MTKPDQRVAGLAKTRTLLGGFVYGYPLSGTTSFGF